MKEGNWIPLDKNLIHFLPRDRPYTILEAMFSFRFDMDNNDVKSEIAYSRIWSWSRSKVRRFVTDLKTGARHAPDSRETGKRHEVRIIFNNLEEAKDRQKTGKRQAKDRDETGTINPNPNPNPNPKKFIIPTIEEITDYCTQRNNNVNPQKFFSHYTSNGWMVGKNKMKDWKAAIITWEGNLFNANGKDEKPISYRERVNQAAVDGFLKGEY